VKILYFAFGQKTTASSRLRVYKIAEVLRRLGDIVDIKISYADVGKGDYDLIVVQKRQDFSREMNRWLGNGIPVVFDIDDPTDRIPPHTMLTVGSKELQKRHENSVYIPDCLDLPFDYSPKVGHRAELKKVCWFGLACNLYNAKPVYNACCELGMELVVVTDLYGKHEYPEWEHATYIEWELDTVDEVITRCDLVACPYIFSGKWNADWIQAKGENRLLKAWALGMPVIGTPIPSYVEHGLRYPAMTEPEWVDALSALKDRNLRKQDAERGRLVASERVADNVARKWKEVFNATCS